MPSMNLFLCGTPLHSLMAKRIIEYEELDKSQCALFFYSRFKSKKYEHYYDQISNLCEQSVFFYTESSYPGYLIEAKKVLKGFDYDCLYFGNAGSPYVLLALSAGKHQELVTFDDGVQNIFAGSPFASKHGISLRKYLGLLPFRNRYTVQRIREESSRHYTIYPGFKNHLSDSPTPISIFSSVGSPGGDGTCSVILGTNFKNAFPVKSVGRAYERLADFAESLEGDVFYLPHPRDHGIAIRGCINVETEKIAEEFIGEMYSRYGRFNLYGFCSSAQLNLAHLSNVHNYFLSIPLFDGWIDEVVAMLAVAGAPVEGIISIEWS